MLFRMGVSSTVVGYELGFPLSGPNCSYPSNDHFLVTSDTIHRSIIRYVFFYKHMKFRIQARLCLAIYNFEARIMLSLCLTFQGTELPV